MVESIGVWGPFLLLVIGLVLGLPIAYSMMLAGGLGLILTIGVDGTLSLFASLPRAASSNYILATVPMFILMAELLSNGRLTRLVFEAASGWFGSLRGGLAMGVVGANGIFGALCGSSMAAAGLLAKVSVPALRERGYSERLSLGVVAASGTFSTMIPPSIALVIYGITTETSIAALFAAGLLPATVTFVVYLFIIRIWCSRPGSRPQLVAVSWSERFRATMRILPVIPLVALVLGGIYAGIMTPSEAAGVGALGALVVSVVFGGMRWSGFKAAVSGTVLVSSMVMLILVAASVFGRWLSVSGITTGLVGMITESALAPAFVMTGIVLLYVGLGTFMSEVAIMLLTLPLTFPVVTSLGYDPIWFGIVVAKTVEIGLLTPPLGLNVFVVNGVAGGRIGDAFSGAGVFLFGEAVVLSTLLLWPEPFIAAGKAVVGG